ncbi:acyltransferase family protein [Terriglobus albidus]|uniref:acyltransferase family protein n=1 Tax=Terriglobus albidus TaxID=1592106 RepID=UPI0021E06E83|nr:heparan-alpha-glucosaminide N-acetyltransferase domain-containing protein [Terriglobus albidus]
MTLSSSIPRPEVSNEGQAPSSSPRLTSLDVLRGLTIALMIMVNTSGDGAHTFPFLSHAAWNGCTLADVVFPCFLFMVGISIVFSLRGKLRKGVPSSTIILQAAKRTLVLFAIGLAVSSFPHYTWHTFRVFGVLQRIAICFFVATLLYLKAKPRTLVVVTVSILLGYWILLRWVPVPGFGMPGVDVPFLDPVGNFPAWLDRHLLPASHLYRIGFYDPEGLLSSVPSLATALLGVLTGIWITRHGVTSATARGLLTASVSLLTLSGLWSIWFPLNKRLWTSSFVLFNAGLSLLVLWLFFRIIDLRPGKKRFIEPALVFGTNSLAVYAFSEFFAGTLDAIRLPSHRTVQQWLFHPLTLVFPNLYIAALAYALLFVGVCYLPMLALYRKRIFIKI